MVRILIELPNPKAYILLEMSPEAETKKGQ